MIYALLVTLDHQFIYFVFPISSSFPFYMPFIS